ncbi:small GTP-binding protein, putative [Trichomonas vaginalis G3]|uniref:Small GTP-binding protein, putative n=1 Tax=Trichomonas vaginalis (strain ATCC PRA-98 / G3) TaxID=412133 RepID=A2FR00_TRIV3|nr:GTPase protein [Trichomonas vaginalis G3]EAX92667.1 small GTP-binding protein, putative [Trichomonas vaginalis G3]KAI5512060.1 GTPase protein [Trichomonas vaginalis G3]|eukprot:XP_001305597.1 small GTP-binding protein [Trichomonas vaginalis G3]
MDNDNKEAVEVKAILIGDANVGKTCIATKYVNGSFTDKIEPTVGAAYFTKDVVQNNVNIQLNIWDTAGQESYRYLVPMYYRNAQIAIVVYDVTSEHTFKDVNGWIEDVKRNVGDQIIVIVCANKVDAENRAVTEFDGQDFAKLNNFIYAETSAVTGQGIDKLFQVSLAEYMKQYVGGPVQEKVNLSGKSGDEKKKKDCC